MGDGMAEILINSAYLWTYDGRGKWDYYLDRAINQYAFSNELYLQLGSVEASFLGNDLTYKSNGADHYFLNGGTVTGLYYADRSYSIFISDANVSAKVLDGLMKDGSSAASTKIFAAVLSGDDYLTLGFGADKIAAFGGDDTAFGRSGNDSIDAGAGNDLLYGGLGMDKLDGGTGEDIFVFDTKANPRNIDTLGDFSPRDDTIVLDHLIYRSVGGVGLLAQNAFYASASGKAHDLSDRIIYDTSDGHLNYDTDGTGPGKAVHFATVDANLKLSYQDFDII